MESVTSFFPLGQFCDSVSANQRMEGEVPLTRGSLGSSEGCGTRVTPPESVLIIGCCLANSLSDSVATGATSRSPTNARKDDSFSDILLSLYDKRSDLR
jgi:hypothetical protein